MVSSVEASSPGKCVGKGQVRLPRRAGLGTLVEWVGLLVKYSGAEDLVGGADVENGSGLEC